QGRQGSGEEGRKGAGGSQGSQSPGQESARQEGRSRQGRGREARGQESRPEKGRRQEIALTARHTGTARGRTASAAARPRLLLEFASTRHCEERSDEAIQGGCAIRPGLLRCARNDEGRE